MSADSVAHDQLRAFIERLERMHEERKAIATDISEIYAEAKGNGFDVPTIKSVLKIRGQDHAERMEKNALLDLYLSALGMADPPREDDDYVPSRSRAPAPARAHVENIEEFAPETGETIEIPGSHAPAQPTGVNPETPAGTAAVGETVRNQAETPNDIGSGERAVTGIGPESTASYAGRSVPEDARDAASTAVDEPAARDPGEPAANGRSGKGVPLASKPAPVATDRTKANPDCRDQAECGVEGSWDYFCEACKLAKAQRRVVEAVQ